MTADCELLYTFTYKIFLRLWLVLAPARLRAESRLKVFIVVIYGNDVDRFYANGSSGMFVTPSESEGLQRTPEHHAQATMWMTRGYEERLAGDSWSFFLSKNNTVLMFP